MVEFVILSEHLLYEAKSLKAIQCVMNRFSFSYTVKHDIKDIVKDRAMRIYLVELEMKYSISILEQIQKRDPLSCIVCFTNQTEKRTLLLQRHIRIVALLNKNVYYQDTLQKVLDKAIQNEQLSRDILHCEPQHIYIPLEDIKYIMRCEDHVIITAETQMKQQYQLIVKMDFDFIMKQLDSNFACYSNRYAIKNECSFISDFNYKKKYVKPYSKDLYDEVMSLYEKGVSLKKLSEQFPPCYHTILHWVKKYEYEKRVKEMEYKVRQFDQIYEIVNREE